jgi:hypothetical protein
MAWRAPPCATSTRRDGPQSRFRGAVLITVNASAAAASCAAVMTWQCSLGGRRESSPAHSSSHRIHLSCRSCECGRRHGWPGPDIRTAPLARRRAVGAAGIGKSSAVTQPPSRRPSPGSSRSPHGRQARIIPHQPGRYASQEGRDPTRTAPGNAWHAAKRSAPRGHHRAQGPSLGLPLGSPDDPPRACQPRPCK